MRGCCDVGRTFKDFPVGSRFVSGLQTISAAEIVEFARRYDPQPFHTTSDPGENLLGGLAASGWQTAAISMRLFIDTMEVEGGIIGRAIDELRWPKAVHPGDSIRVEIEILEARLSKSKTVRSKRLYDEGARRWIKPRRYAAIRGFRKSARCGWWTAATATSSASAPTATGWR